ncbi:N-6 DNA methylase [Bifidobacterium biavatii]|uniref:Type I restriction-modification system methyltransferase subunit n=1 Tax=Bifidobacterium biavatii DSM 23969 TaxID=1437608 RepID=A0A087A0C8_9BIFI|nr:N-6 DNA methylase [Bifidobacterium biavatii]KFI52228.1 type I restriction-modification system methyltransferase subunit [Bifidobacterium biavatii DSM 23969]
MNDASLQQNRIASADIARMAGVRPSAVSNWRNRENKHFPDPVDSKDGRPLFDYDDVVAWLTANGIAFKDVRAEQSVWSFFDQWRGQADPDTTASLLLWSVCLGKTASRLGLHDAWKDLLAKDRQATDATLPRRCVQLVETVLDHAIKTDANQVAVLRFALSQPCGLETLSAEDTRRLLIFADGLASHGDDETNRLVSMLLERNIISQGRMSGEFGYPNSRISCLLARLAAAYWADQEHPERQPITLYDPACGILEAALQFGTLRQDQNGSAPQLTMDAVEINSGTAITAARRFVLSGLPDAILQIKAQDSLTQDPFPATRSDIVITEPPFGMRRELNAMDPRWRYGLPSKTDSTLAWIQDAIAHLAESGRAFVVTTARSLSSAGADTDIRRTLIAAGCVEAIISLPSNMYINTVVPTFVWILSAPNRSRDTVTMISVAEDRDRYQSQDESPAWMKDTLDWFVQDRTRPGKPIAVRVVRSISILGNGRVSLLPSDWLGRDTPNPADIKVSYLSRRATLVNARSQALDAFGIFDAFDENGFDCSDIGFVKLGDIATIKQGDYAGPERTSRNWSGRYEQPELPADVISVDDVHSHRFRGNVSGPSASGEDGIITRNNDILLTGGGHLSAMIDASGGRHVHKSVSVARLIDERWDPQYVALMIESSWNNELSEVPWPRRGARPAQLEIPALPLSQQHRIVEYARAVDTLRRQADLYREQLDTLASAARYGAMIGKVGEDSMANVSTDTSTVSTNTDMKNGAAR